jgi:GNAT superfamily N-acetyltransferase
MLQVEPNCLRGGVGKLLFAWATGIARSQGADCLMIESDPGAVPFYRRMGARVIGSAPSGSIPRRVLPVMVKELGSID